MPNTRIFAPEYSTDSIWRDNDMSRCLSDDLDVIEADIAALETGKADVNHTHDNLSTEHTHPEYALVNHTHTEYATVSHTHNDYAPASLVGDTSVAQQIEAAIATKADDDHEHNEYALTTHLHDNYAQADHVHDNYASATHAHTEYADADHNHNYSDLIGAPASLPANGGNANTVGGKYANEFASASEFATLCELVGDESVSAQIETAMNGVANATHAHAISDVTGLSGDLDAKYEKPSTGIPKTDLAASVQTSLNKADSAVQSLSGYATETYVNTKVAGIVDTAPEALNTLNELAAALGDDPNFATTVATQIGTKVDKVNGKGLSSNDYTNTEKTKLAGISAGANKTVVDTALSATSTNPVQNKVVNTAIAGVQTALNNKFDKTGGAISGNLTVFTGGTSSVVLRAPDNSNGDQAYSRIYKNASATADYGLQLRDLAHGGGTTNTSSLLMICDKQSDLASKLQFVRQLNGTNTYYKLYGEHNKPTLSDIGITATVAEVNKLDGLTATTAELNYVDGVTSNIQTQLNGKAASSHGTHVTFTTTNPKVAGTAAVGSATTVSRSDHVHPAQTTVSGNAGSATKLATARTIRTNLGSTSTASFDGTANVAPGISGTLAITHGGTGATSAASAVTNLGIADYVVAQGTDGIWTYRKWNSGVAECWGSSTINYNINCTTQQAQGVYTDSTFKDASASLPSGLFTSVSFATANARSNGYSIAQVSGMSATTLTYRMWCSYPTTLNTNAVIDLHVKGNWK